MKNSEYDSFGPWIYEISEDYPVPKQFVKYIRISEHPLLSIKIPRQIERRKISPEMPMYDYVVSMFENDFIILKRKDKGIIKNLYLYKEIESIRNRENLLNGNLQIVMSDGGYNLPYNTVSSSIINRMIDIMRHKYSKRNRLISIENQIFNKNQLNFSFYFSGIVTEEQFGNPEFEILSYQEEKSIGKWETGLFNKLVNCIFDKRILESVHLSDGREILIISRGIPFKNRRQAVYSKETFYIPIENIRTVLWEEDSNNSSLLKMMIISSNTSYPIIFLKKNNTVEQYIDFFKRVCGCD